MQYINGREWLTSQIKKQKHFIIEIITNYIAFFLEAFNYHNFYQLANALFTLK